MEETDLIKCSNCGKEAYGFETHWFELKGHTVPICNRCMDKMYKYPILMRWYRLKTGIKKGVGTIGYFILLFLFVALCLLFIYFWVGGCVGNALNVDEEITPELHWKPNK